MEDDTFENLAVWRRADCRDRGFKDQITRSGNSIADNIAEGSERPGRAEFRQFLGYAKGSAGETRSQVLRAKALAYLSASDVEILVRELKEISRMIHGLYRSLE